MLEMSATKRNAWENATQKNLVLKFSDGTQLDNDNIYSESMTYIQSLCDESALAYGKCTSASFTTKIFNTSKSFKGLYVTPTFEISVDKTKQETVYDTIETYEGYFDGGNTDDYTELPCYTLNNQRLLDYAINEVTENDIIRFTCSEKMYGIVIYTAMSHEIPLTVKSNTYDFTGEDINFACDDVDEPLSINVILEDTSITDATITVETIKVSQKEVAYTETYEYALGKFLVTSDSRTSDKKYKELKCYDAMYEINNADVSDWYNGLTFPMTLKAFRNSFFTQVGITQESISLPNDGISLAKTINPSTLTGQDVIQAICELNGCFGQITTDNTFRYVYIHGSDTFLYPDASLYPSDTLYPDGYGDYSFTMNEYVQSGLTYQDYTCQQVTSVHIVESDDDLGGQYPTDTLGTNPYTIKSNTLILGDTTENKNAYAQNIYDKIKVVKYAPLTLKSWAKPWVELGDYITVATTDGNVESVVLKKTMSGIQACFDSYESKGTETYGEQKDSITSSIVQLKGKTNELTRTVEETSSKIDDVEVELGTVIKQTASSIELSATDNSTSCGITIKLKDKDGKELASDDANITMNGLVKFTDLSESGSTTINGSNITTGEINANLIKSGTITSTSGSTSLNLDNDAFNFGKGSLTYSTDDGFKMGTFNISENLLKLSTDKIGAYAKTYLTIGADGSAGYNGVIAEYVSTSSNSYKAQFTPSMFDMTQETSYGSAELLIDYERTKYDIDTYITYPKLTMANTYGNTFKIYADGNNAEFDSDLEFYFNNTVTIPRLNVTQNLTTGGYGVALIPSGNSAIFNFGNINSGNLIVKINGTNYAISVVEVGVG